MFPGKRFPRSGEDSADQLPADCRETYNYKTPHPCKPGVDCAFVVKWQALGEGWAEYDVMASLAGLNHTSSLWVAMGFSSSSDMVSAGLVSIRPYLLYG